MTSQDVYHELVEIVFDRFYKSAEWPTLRGVYLTLKRRYPDLGLSEDDLRQYLGVYTHDASVAFRVKDFAALADENTQLVLWDFLLVIREIGQKQLASPEDNPHIRASDLRSKFSRLNDLDWRRIVRLMEREGYILGGGTGGDQFDCEIGPEAHRFADLDSIEAYVAEREALQPRLIVADAHEEEAPEHHDFVTVKGFQSPSVRQ